MDKETWGNGPGVMVLANGRRVRGRGLSKPLPEGPSPEFGLYLLGKEPPAMPWPSRWLQWPDFWLPRDRLDTRKALAEVFERCATERVEIACGGGKGRTGTALACLCVLAGTPPADAVAYVRAHYDAHAVETPWQRRFVGRFLP